METSRPAFDPSWPGRPADNVDIESPFWRGSIGIDDPVADGVGDCRSQRLANGPCDEYMIRFGVDIGLDPSQTSGQ